MLVLTLVLQLATIDGDVGNGIPRVVDPDEQEQKRGGTDDEQCRYRIAWEHYRGDDECCVGDERQCRMPQPVFEHRLIFSLTTCPPYNDDDVCCPPRP